MAYQKMIYSRLLTCYYILDSRKNLRYEIIHLFKQAKCKSYCGYYNRNCSDSHNAAKQPSSNPSGIDMAIRHFAYTATGYEFLCRGTTNLYVDVLATTTA